MYKNFCPDIFKYLSINFSAFLLIRSVEMKFQHVRKFHFRTPEKIPKNFYQTTTLL
ncbi:Uncharacterized protein dnm_071570 [Desulfonema magnum]|uniref:Uncharacterized protein n=1 Tax=Desulfonema magnum TaxID=45655 RepID=A0A975GRN5_9BACT|nr:Uncharacterized protein dnm_071570 [Desulfonema magnum]